MFELVYACLWTSSSESILFIVIPSSEILVQLNLINLFLDATFFELNK